MLCFLVVGGNNNEDQHGIVHTVQNVEVGERQNEQVLSQPQEQLDTIVTKTPDQIEQVKSEVVLGNKLQSNLLLQFVVATATEESSESDKDSNTKEVPQVSGQGVSCALSNRDPSIDAEDRAILTSQNESCVILSISDKNSCSTSSRDLGRKTSHDETDLPVTNIIAAPSDQDLGDNERTSAMEKSEEVQELTMTQNDSDLNVMQATETSPDQDIVDHEKPSTNEKSEEKQEETNSAATIIASNVAATTAEKSNSLDTELQVPENQLDATGEASEPPDPSVNSIQSVNKEMDQRKFSQESSSTESDVEVLTTYGIDQIDNFNQENSDALKQKSTEDTAAELGSEISSDENEKRLKSETALPQFGSTNNESLMVEPIVQSTAQEKNFESVGSCSGPQQQENPSDNHITVSHCGEQNQPQLKDLGSLAAITDVKNSETDAIIDSMPSRDIEAENRLMTALRLSCKLSPGHLVKALDVKGVVSIHLLRSLSPGVVTIAELVHKLVYLTDLDLSGNLLGPQGFRVICLVLRTNNTLKCLNLANNLADTDSSVSTKTKAALATL